MMVDEVYVLCSERSARMAKDLLAALAPHRESCSEDFPFLQFADTPEIVLTSAEEAIEWLDESPCAGYSLYWKNTLRTEPWDFMLFYTEDGGLIVGITAYETNTVAWLERLAKLTGGEYGYVTGEDPPPATKVEFIDLCRTSQITRMVRGKIYE
jgi:hypothetical protein